MRKIKCFIAREYDASVDVLSSLEEVLKEFGAQYCDMYSEQNGMNVKMHVFNAIQDSQIVIGIVTRNSNNVFFEIGMAIGMGKQVLLLVDDSGSIPFDLKGVAYIKINKNLKENLKLPVQYMFEAKVVEKEINLAEVYKDGLQSNYSIQDVNAFEQIRFSGDFSQLEQLVKKMFEELRGQYSVLKYNEFTKDMNYDMAIWIDELEGRIINPVRIELRFGTMSNVYLKERVKNLEMITKSDDLVLILYCEKSNKRTNYHSGESNVIVVEVEEFFKKAFECGLAQAILYFRNIAAHGRSCE